MTGDLGRVSLAVFRTSVRLEAACDYASVRELARAARKFLDGRGLLAAELDAWELVLIEAGNNAVEYAGEAARSKPVRVELLCDGQIVEARVTDHTPGFDWPERAELPETDSEGGRGLFLIQTLTDESVYLRGRHQNLLILRKRRTEPAPTCTLAAEELERRLAELEDIVAAMTEELASNYESLTALFRYSAQLGSATDLPDFSRRLVGDLVQITEADLAVLRLLSGDRERLETLLTVPGSWESQPMCQGRSLCGELECDAIRTRQDVWYDAGRALPCQTMLGRVPGIRVAVCHPFFVADQPIGTLTLARTGSERPFTAAQINLLHTFIDYLGIQIVNARLTDERTQARVTQRELEIAAGIQRSLLPASLPDCAPFELAASALAAHQVGGDLYDVIPAGDAGVMLVIADVMGKGVPAALFSAILRSAVRSHPTLFPHPAELLTTLNRTLWDDFSRVDMFATVALVFLDARRRTLTTASAGHCPVLLAAPGEAAQAVGDAGLPLGILAESTYRESRVEVPRAGCALLYTDGLTETRDPSGELFGEARLEAWLSAAAASHTGADVLRDRLLESLATFRVTPSLSDDLTFLVVRHVP